MFYPPEGRNGGSRLENTLIVSQVIHTQKLQLTALERCLFEKTRKQTLGFVVEGEVDQRQVAARQEGPQWCVNAVSTDGESTGLIAASEAQASLQENNITPGTRTVTRGQFLSGNCGQQRSHPKSPGQ